MNTLQAIGLFAIFAIVSPKTISSEVHAEAVLLCHGLGETVGLIHQQRKKGVPDKSNRGIAILRQIQQQNLLPAIDAFIKNTTPLPSAWRATLFTHACLYGYTEKTQQVVLMSQLISTQCNLKRAEASCIETVFAKLPEYQII